MTEFSLVLLLKAIKLARWTYYYHLKQLDKTDKDQELKAEIQSIFIEHKGNYAYRRIYLELRNRAYLVNHKRVQGLMKVLNLQAKMRQKRKYSSHKGDVGKKAENLIQGQFEGEYLRAENAILKKLRELRLKEEKEKEERQKLFKN
ncbi:integrase core domain-containing protein [Streptococcus pneumoniae]|nr:integrase core domain-containing protein [Streptococcus pneumoniae]